MSKTLNSFFIFTLLVLLNFSTFGQSSETIIVEVLDQNGESITVGIVSLSNKDGKAITRIELGKKVPSINVAVGSYILDVQSPGFKTYKNNIEIKKGQNRFEVKLEVAEINVNIKVEQGERENRLDEVMSSYLSEKEIASLPENGEDIKEELQKRYGDDILIRIDGDFEGSQVPSRAEISSIKVIQNAFDAEFHEIGRTIIDIRTNTIANGFHGFASVNFNSSVLNARNPFDLKRQPANSGNLIAFFSGPIIKNKTSFNLSVISFGRTTTQTFIGTGYSATIVPQKIGSSFSLTSLGIKHNLPKNHLLNFKYQNYTVRLRSVGLGAFDLPERAANKKTLQHKFTVIESGTFKNKYANDFTFEFTEGIDTTLPKSIETTILVLNAFNRGGLGINNRTETQKFRITDNLIFDAKKHSFKLGAEIEAETLNNISANNLNGTFTFLNLTDYTNIRPIQFSQTLGKTEYNLSQLRAAFYFQDNFKPLKTIQFGIGLRYEIQNDLQDFDNFSPRIGYVWSPEKSGKFIIRGGTGVYYDWLDTGTLSSIRSNDGRQGPKIIIRNPSYPDPFISGISLQSLPQNISKLADNLVSPTIFVTQHGFNYKFDKALTFEGIYTFKKGWHHFRSRNINAPINGVRPNPAFGIIQLLESSGNTQDQSFELKINGYYKGVNMYANYELSDDTSDFSSALGLPMDNYNLRLDHSVSSLEQKHKLNISLNFDLFKKINISPSFRLESGLPYTITTGKDDNGDLVRPLRNPKSHLHQLFVNYF